MSARILVIHFRAPGFISFEREPIERILGDTHNLVFKNALADEVEWAYPQKETSGFDGVIIAGSAVLYFDGGKSPSHEGRRQTSALVAEATPFVQFLFETDVPTLGICFGHQLLGHAAGASVGYSAAEGKTGTYSIQVTVSGVKDPFMRGVPQEFRANYGHKDVLLELPSGAEILAHGEDRCRFAALRFAPRIYGVQFHPDYSLDDLREMLTRYPEYASGGAKADDLFEDTKDSERLLRNFAALC